MNRLVLIGNGFDLAHGLKTSYKDFIDWYWRKCGERLLHEYYDVVSDELCSFKLKTDIVSSWYLVWTGYYYKRKDPTIPWDVNDVVNLAKENRELCDFSYNSVFFSNIQHNIETKGWVDIEIEYYKLLKLYSQSEDGLTQIATLNKQLNCLQEKLVEYLRTIEIPENQIRADIRQKIYDPFIFNDFLPEGQRALKEHVDTGLRQDTKSWDDKLSQYGSICYTSGYVSSYREKHNDSVLLNDEVPVELLLPNHIMLLNFNYTKTANMYCKNGSIFSVNQIHGCLDNPSSIIFGYGDELDEGYNKLKNKNNNECLQNMKQIKYMMADNYDRLVSFLESEPFQVYLMGHSCGNSDRTLLNMIFEHRNCVSIKPYYYIYDKGGDNYQELTMNISRNFIEDAKLMRNRMVKKPNCVPLTKS